MITDLSAPTRERLLDAAIELFGSKGYAGTSIGEIESAAGLSPRSGALYKHFASKRELLYECVRRRGREVNELAELIEAHKLGDIDVEVHLMGRMLLREIGHDQPVLRIVMRESDNFPELRDEFYARIVRNSHSRAAAWLRLVAERVGAPADQIDFEALVGLLFGSIVNFRVLDTIFGRTPLDVDEERFLATWERATRGALAAHGLIPETEA